MRSPKRNLGGLSHLRCAWRQHVRGNNSARGRKGLTNVACDTSQTACAVDVSPVMCTGLEGLNKKSLCKEAKRTVNKVKFKRYVELYNKLETNEGNKKINRLAKVRKNRFKVF